jgi:hypothetical protein
MILDTFWNRMEFLDKDWTVSWQQEVCSWHKTDFTSRCLMPTADYQNFWKSIPIIIGSMPARLPAKAGF